MTAPPDHAQRQRALQPNQSFIVQAPAGAGKTELLVRRYLALLATVDQPEQILAITFTKKATAEMRIRISNALNRVGENGEPLDDDSENNREILALVEAALVNDRKHDWHITANPRRLRIQTIDAFCNELVRRMPWSARFGSPPDIVDDATPLYLRAAKISLDHIEQKSEYADACQHLLGVVDADWNKAHTLLANMLAKRDKWMRLLGTANREHLETMWQQVIDLELQHATEMISAQMQGNLIELGAFAAGQLIESERDSAVRSLHNRTQFPEASHRCTEQWRGIVALLLTNEGLLRKTVNVVQGFPVDTAENKEVKVKMMALLTALRNEDELVDALVKARLLPGGNFSDAQWRSIDALMRLLPLAAAELKLIFKEQNQADYIELTQRAALALFDADYPSDLALAFDYQLAHLLMDEFQDTSSAHIDLLAKLTAGWQNGDGRTLFLVGDPMQSIYRFREAEVANFLQVQQHGLGDLRPESILLTANFRSAPALVDWFNQTFREVLPAHDDIINGAVSYAPARAHTNADGAVHIHADIERGREHEAQCVANLIKQAQDDDATQTIAVLGRSRPHLHAIAAQLRQCNIAHQAVDLEKLNDRPAIRDLLAITRALAQPADRIAWLSLLRAPWCGLNLADLTVLAADDHAATIIERCRDEKLMVRLSDDGRARLLRLLGIIDTAMQRSGRIGLRENVEAAWLCLGGPATIEASDLDDCQRYLERLSAMEANRIEITADNLKQSTDDLWARGGGDARVQLLTIHKAKGLEFDIVFLPCLERRPRSDEKTLLQWQKLPQQLLFAPLPSSIEQEDAFYPYLEHLEKIHTHNELCRLLYVACTRAKKQLHLFGDVGAKDGVPKAPARNSLLSLLWPLVQEQYADAVSTHTAAHAAATTDENQTHELPQQTLRRLPLPWQAPAFPQSIPVAADALEATNEIEFSWAGEVARVAGVVIHQILEQVDEIGWTNWRERVMDEQQKTLWRNQLMENGLFGNDLDTVLSQVTKAVDNARQDSKAAWIFSGDHHDIKTEWPLSGWVDGKVAHIVIDRSFIDDNGVRWIIDFKSSRHEGADPDIFLDREQQRHQNQLARYAKIVSQLQPNEVRLGLYFPSLRGWREWAG